MSRKLQEVRREKRITIQKLADMTGVNPSKIDRAEQGDQCLLPREMISISQVLGLSVEEMFGVNKQDLVKSNKAVGKFHAYIWSSLVMPILLNVYTVLLVLKSGLKFNKELLKSFAIVFEGHFILASLLMILGLGMSTMLFAKAQASLSGCPLRGLKEKQKGVKIVVGILQGILVLCILFALVLATGIIKIK